MNIVPKSGGNALHGSFFASGTGAKFQSNNLTPALSAQGVTAPTPLTKVYDVIGDARRSDPDGSAVVFRQRAHRRQHEGQRQRLLQPERRRSRSPWLYAPDVSRQRVLRPHFRERQRPPHLAGDAAQQGERLLGCAVPVPDLHGRHGRPAGARARVAGSRRRPRPAARCDAGHMVLARHEPAACSRRASAASSSASATSSATPIRRGISFASPSNARADARRTATFPGWSIDRRTSAWRTPAPICGRDRSPTSPARIV